MYQVKRIYTCIQTVNSGFSILYCKNINKSTTLRIIMSSLDKKQGSVPKQIALLGGF